MKSVDAMRDEILAKYPRLGLDDTFSFRCHPGLSCFNQCCGDVNIFLTPYDVLRLKKRLSLSSGEFLERYTLKPFTAEQKLPVVVLKMDETKEGKPCPFVRAEGCSVYEDRPWPCRMYPVGAASSRTEDAPEGPEFYFLMNEEPCDGFKEGTSWTIRTWMENQGVGPHDEAGARFKEISLHPHFRRGGSLNPQQMEMYFTACYDLDRFRAFVFESSFLERYEVEPELTEKMRTDDQALLDFAFRWLRACLFSEGTVRLRASVRRTFEERMARQKPGG